VGEIYVIAVDPDAHGSGLGRALLAAGFAHLAAGGAETGWLWVDEGNRTALDLYRGFGMDPVSVSSELEPQKTVLADI
jgi:mycothiol synthase